MPVHVFALFVLFTGGVTGITIDQCKKDSIDDVKVCAQKVWNERQADYSTLNK